MNIILPQFKAPVFCNSLIYRWVNIVFVITTFCTTASRDGLRLKTEGAAIQKLSPNIQQHRHIWMVGSSKFSSLVIKLH